ncbi:F0F1 ATP synthase subunit epsilon [Insolitispirillum peregrinum]|uniref:ATP synthase epsilon chain n=1 Tax=Insolitispirillum peregrinum TaxID=80876 RepID=A0A1N7K0G1_9PROT|nr:F0F1 ATP synthase subunit epsilon [Insolitispirillum peregrinum]SIS55072.1 ATP synthase F1 subcomplex epsilon subunit [Insolitispirillum peregrinum]
MAETLEFELVSPSKLLISQPVEMVVVPGSEGNFGALPQHAPMLSTVRPGVIDIYQKGAVVNRIFVAGGFAEVTETRCTVLAEEAVPLADLSRDAVQARLTAAREALQEADQPLEKAQAKNRIAVAEAMLAALS